MSDSDLRADHGPTPLSRPGGALAARLSTLALAAGLAGGIPVPWLPYAVRRRVRGAIAHDVAARHGVSLTPAARQALAEPTLDDRGRVAHVARGAVAFFARRTIGRLGVLAAVPTFTAGAEAWALGMLLDRYLTEVRPSRAVRMEEHESRRLRVAIDRALVLALSPELRAPAFALDPDAPEEMRDPLTQLVDRALLGAAALPVWLEQRLAAAFDEVAARSELGRA